MFYFSLCINLVKKRDVYDAENDVVFIEIFLYYFAIFL